MLKGRQDRFMEIKLKLFLIILLTCFVSVYSQTRSIKGIVTDAKKESLAFVTVMAKPTDSSKSMKFAMTNDLGQYILELEENSSYEIEFTTMGFENFKFIQQLDSHDVRKDVQLTEKIHQLDAVVIDIPIIVKKDTLVYKTDKFITGEERKLKDVLAKLPGIEVDDDGNVTSNGKKITHMLVENKSFFGGNSKLAVENIPANAVRNVEVIDDYNEISFLKGMHKSDKMAMNIKLKEGKKNFLFGDVEVGKGNKNYYQGKVNMFYYKPAFNINLISGINNSGKKTLTQKDYDGFKNSSSSVFKSRDINIEKSGIKEFVEPNDVIKSQQKVAALNLFKEINKKLDVSTCFIVSSSENHQLQERINQYLIPENNYTEIVKNVGVMNKNFGIGKLNIDYKLSSKEEIIVNLLGKKSIQDGSENLTSTINTDSRLFDDISNKINYYADMSLEWHRKIKKKHALSFSTIATYNNNDYSGYWRTNQEFLDSLVPLVLSDIYKLNYLRNKKKDNVKSILKYYWTISNDNLFHFTIGNSYIKEHFITNDKQILADNEDNNFDSAGFNNDLMFKLNDFYMGIHSDFRIGKYEFAQSIFAHKYQWIVDQINPISVDKWIYLPDFQVRADYRGFGRFRFNYKMTNSFTDVSKLANRFYLKSYNSAYKGNENLKNALTNSYSLSFTKSNIFKQYYLLILLNYKEKLNGIIDYAITEATDNYFSSIMADDIFYSLTGNVFFRKMYRNFKVNLKTNISNSLRLGIINNVLVENENINGGYDFSIESRYDKLPILKLGFKQSFGKNTSIGGDYNYKIENPSLKIEYDFFKHYIFSCNYEYYRYKNITYKNLNTYSLSGMKFIYDNKNTHWAGRVAVDNLFDVRFKNKNNFSNYITSDINTYILPRIFMLTLIYKI